MSHSTLAAAELIARTRKIAGQVAAIEEAIRANASCATVLHRTAAVRGAVAGLMDEIMITHLQVHVARPELSDEVRADAAEEMATVIRRYLR